MSPRSIRFASSTSRSRGEQLHPPDRVQVEPQRVDARLDRQVRRAAYRRRQPVVVRSPSPTSSAARGAVRRLVGAAASAPTSGAAPSPITSTPASTSCACSSRTPSAVSSTSSSAAATCSTSGSRARGRARPAPRASSLARPAPPAGAPVTCKLLRHNASPTGRAIVLSPEGAQRVWHASSAARTSPATLRRREPEPRKLRDESPTLLAPRRRARRPGAPPPHRGQPHPRRRHAASRR